MADAPELWVLLSCWRRVGKADLPAVVVAAESPGLCRTEPLINPSSMLQLPSSPTIPCSSTIGEVGYRYRSLDIDRCVHKATDALLQRLFHPDETYY